MAIRTIVTEGYGNGTFNGTIPLVVTQGYATGRSLTQALSESLIIVDLISSGVSRIASDSVAIVDDLASVFGVVRSLAISDSVAVRDFGQACVERALDVTLGRLSIIRMSVARMPIVRDVCRFFGIGGSIE